VCLQVSRVIGQVVALAKGPSATLSLFDDHKQGKRRSTEWVVERPEANMYVGTVVFGCCCCVSCAPHAAPFW